MLAKLTRNHFSDPEWIFERKLDGMRCILHKDNDQILVWSRNKINQNNVFPELVSALKKYKSNFILDCEIVAFAGKKTSFEKLQPRMHTRKPDINLIRQVPITVFVFDILYLNGYDLTGLPLLVRKKILKDNFKFSKPLKLISFKVKTGLEYFKYACEHGWEGIMAKQANSTYIHKRSPHWLKFKCDFGQELVIGGYTSPQGSRVKFGALLLGYYQHGKFKYAGKVGTGFNVDTLLQLAKKMQKLQIAQSPFVDYDLKSKDVTWLKPKLVAQLGYSEWTSTGRLRHPRYLGLRLNKSASDVRREK